MPKSVQAGQKSHCSLAGMSLGGAAREAPSGPHIRASRSLLELGGEALTPPGKELQQQGWHWEGPALGADVRHTSSASCAHSCTQQRVGQVPEWQQPQPGETFLERQPQPGEGLLGRHTGRGSQE